MMTNLYETPRLISYEGPTCLLRGDSGPETDPPFPPEIDPIDPGDDD